MTSISAIRVPNVRSYRFITPNTPDAAKIARDHVAALLRHSRSPVPVDIAMLLVSELVGNSYQHTTSASISLTTTIQPSRVHVDVYDSDPTPIPTPGPSIEAELADRALVECGRGLLMLHMLAFRWDWELCGGDKPLGKSVWFELRHQPEALRGR